MNAYSVAVWESCDSFVAFGCSSEAVSCAVFLSKEASILVFTSRANTCCKLSSEMVDRDSLGLHLWGHVNHKPRVSEGGRRGGSFVNESGHHFREKGYVSLCRGLLVQNHSF